MEELQELLEELEGLPARFKESIAGAVPTTAELQRLLLSELLPGMQTLGEAVVELNDDMESGMVEGFAGLNLDALNLPEDFADFTVDDATKAMHEKIVDFLTRLDDQIELPPDLALEARGHVFALRTVLGTLTPEDLEAGFLEMQRLQEQLPQADAPDLIPPAEELPTTDEEPPTDGEEEEPEAA